MFEEFYEEKEKRSSSAKRFEDFFTANDIADDKRAALFLEFAGEEICQLLNDLLYPVKPDSKSFKELVECLQKHFESPKVKIAERCKLLKRLQKKDETIAEYAQSLRELAETCQYGEFLDDALTQCFVCGLADSVIQRRLLLKDDLRFENAVDFGSMMEKAKLEEKNCNPISESADDKLRLNLSQLMQNRKTRLPKNEQSGINLEKNEEESELAKHTKTGDSNFSKSQKHTGSSKRGPSSLTDKKEDEYLSTNENGDIRSTKSVKDGCVSNSVETDEWVKNNWEDIYSSISESHEQGRPENTSAKIMEVQRVRYDLYVKSRTLL